MEQTNLTGVMGYGTFQPCLPASDLPQALGRSCRHARPSRGVARSPEHFTSMRVTRRPVSPRRRARCGSGDVVAGAYGANAEPGEQAAERGGGEGGVGGKLIFERSRGAGRMGTTETNARSRGKRMTVGVSLGEGNLSGRRGTLHEVWGWSRCHDKMTRLGCLGGDEVGGGLGNGRYRWHGPRGTWRSSPRLLWGFDVSKPMSNSSDQLAGCIARRRRPQVR